MHNTLHMFDDSRLLSDGLKVLINRHENMQRNGLPHEPSIEILLALYSGLSDAPDDAETISQAQRLLDKHDITDFLVHAANCRNLFASGEVELALRYCRDRRIVPPSCPIEVECRDDRFAQDKAERTVSDPRWWQQQLHDRPGVHSR